MIDTAPMGVVSDAFPLLRKVDEARAATRIGLCTRDTAASLREQLALLGEAGLPEPPRMG